MTTFKDITVVVQGPVQTFQDRAQEPGITEKCLKSIRHYLPGATIILSTWPGQELADLDYDELVVSADPGPNIRYYKANGDPHRFNNNRQIVSSREGLKRVQTKYAVKLRSDNYLTGNHFVALQKKFTDRCDECRFLQERVVVSNVFTRQYAKGYRVAFHLSDFFYFGLTEDLLALWDLDLLEDTPPPTEPVDRSNFPIDCTQMFWLKALQRFDPSIQLHGLLDATPANLRLSDLCYANNLVIGSPEQIGLGLCQKFLGTARISRPRGKSAQWQHEEWLRVYHNHCLASRSRAPLAYWQRLLLLFLQRCIYVYPTRLETWFKIRKLARAHTAKSAT